MLHVHSHEHVHIQSHTVEFVISATIIIGLIIIGIIIVKVLPIIKKKIKQE